MNPLCNNEHRECLVNIENHDNMYLHRPLQTTTLTVMQARVQVKKNTKKTA